MEKMAEFMVKLTDSIEYSRGHVYIPGNVLPNEKNNWLLEKNVPFVNVCLSNGVKIDAISKMGGVMQLTLSWEITESLWGRSICQKPRRCVQSKRAKRLSIC